MFSKISPHGNWRALRHRNFRILYGASVLTNIGTWAQRIAQDWLVLELTNNNGTYLGIVTALQFLPVMLLSMQGGVLADKVDKRKALKWADCAFTWRISNLKCSNNELHIYFGYFTGRI
jgi:hypothetical protein